MDGWIRKACVCPARSLGCQNTEKWEEVTQSVGFLHVGVVFFFLSFVFCQVL